MFSFFVISLQRAFAIWQRSARGLRARLGCGARFSSLLLQALAGDANAFLLIRSGRTQPANIRADLATLSAIGARHGEVRLLLDRHLNALGNVELDGMRIAEREADGLALKLGAVAHAHDVHFLLK